MWEPTNPAPPTTRITRSGYRTPQSPGQDSPTSCRSFSYVKRFLNTRMRLERMNDGSTIHGWVRDVDKDTITIDPGHHVEVRPKEVFDLEMSAADGHCRLTVEFLRCDGPNWVLKLPSFVRILQQGARTRVRGLELTIDLERGESKVAGKLIDASPNGVALEVETALETEEVVPATAHTPYGEMVALCRVVYCTPAPNAAGRFRVGLTFADLPRLDLARWMRFLKSSAAA